MIARRALLAAGHSEAPEAQADLHVVNTCAITAEAEAKSRQSVRRSINAGAREVYVAGCAVNLDAAQFAGIDRAVRPFVGTADEVAATMAGALGGCADLEHDVLAREIHHGSARDSEQPTARTSGSARVSEQPTARTSGSVRVSEQLTARMSGSVRETEQPAHRTRGFVKVQDGCDCGCAYCIIPAVRGGARSRPASAVLAEVRRRVCQGQPEMVMTGISVGDYRDPERGLELGRLMVEVAKVPGVQRVRLSSVEVIHVKDSLLEALATEPKICPHLHVPMQSGDDQVLRAMGRHYDSHEYLCRIAALRAAVPECNVTTDVIVGFPTEDDAAFRRTLVALDAAGITRAHVFSYSPRPGTAAFALGDRVPPADKKRRSQALRGYSEVRSRHHRAAKLGTRQLVLVDKVADTQCSGYTADYTRCYLPAAGARRGELIDVVCEQLRADGIACR